jgi:hypothetical protein
MLYAKKTNSPRQRKTDCAIRMAGSESGLIRSGSVREKLNALYLIVTKRINVYRGPKYPALRFSIGGLVSQNWQAKRAKQNLWELAVYKM